MKVLQLTAHYYPNVGGVETHLLDLVNVLAQKNIKVYVLTYSPLTSNSKYDIFERSRNIKIFRIPWISGYFYKLVRNPILEFLYLFPGLFLVLPIILLKFKPNVIHCHGLVATTVAVFWGKLFSKKIVTSTHSIYNFPDQGLYREFVKLILNSCDIVLCLSDQSVRELGKLGINPEKTKRFTYWIDLEKFKEIKDAKNKLNLKGKWIFFVGRLIEEKGLRVLLKAAKQWDKRMNLGIVGDGPLRGDVLLVSKNEKNVQYFGIKTQDELPLFYSAADVLMVPSTSEEGFGRVILESLACSTPIVGSNRGAIPEAMNEKVGVLVTASVKNIVDIVNKLSKNPSMIDKMSQYCRKFAVSHYSKRNIDEIIKYYE